MSFWNKLDPTGDNFLGAGKKWGRILAGIMTVGGDEFHRPDPYGSNRNTAFAKGIGGSVTGAAAGAGSGAVVGGPYGAIAGGVLGGLSGGILGALGKTKPNYKIEGFGQNLGIGTASGLAGGYGASAYGGAGAASGTGAGTGASGPGAGTTAGSTSPISNYLQMARGAGGQQQAPPPQQPPPMSPQEKFMRILQQIRMNQGGFNA